VGHVLVHGPRLGFCGCDGDFHLLSGVEEVVAAGEAVIEFGDTPGGNDDDGGLESVEGELEADLVVAQLCETATQFSFATAIWARAIAGRASEVPRRYTFS